MDDDWDALSAEAKEILGCPKKEKTKKVYDRYWRMYENHCKKHNIQTTYSEVSVIDFFINLKDKYSKGSLWSIYLCLNHHFQVRKKTNLKMFARLKIIMKRITEGHVPKKSAVLTEEEIKGIFEKLDDNNPTHLLSKIGVALMYYGLLRCEEVIKIEVKDVRVLENVEIIVKYPYACKTRDKGFEYYVPQSLIGTFEK